MSLESDLPPPDLEGGRYSDGTMHTSDSKLRSRTQQKLQVSSASIFGVYLLSIFGGP